MNGVSKMSTIRAKRIFISHQGILVEDKDMCSIIVYNQGTWYFNSSIDSKLELLALIQVVKENECN